MKNTEKTEFIANDENQHYAEELNNSIKEAESGIDLISFTIEEFMAYTPSK